MKLIKFAAAVFTALFLLATPVFAAADVETADAYKDELKKSSGLIMQSLMSFAGSKGFNINGEMNAVTDTTFLGTTESETQTSKITGFYQLPNKMYMKTASEAVTAEVLLNEKGYFLKIGEDGKWELAADTSSLGIDEIVDSELMGSVDISTLMVAQPIDLQKIIRDIEIVNVFEKDGVKYIDINVADLAGIEDKMDGIKAAIAEGIQSEDLSEDMEDGMEELVQKMIDDMIDSMKITMSGYYRINTSTKTVDGMGYDMVINMEIEVFGFPMTIENNSKTYLKVTVTDEEFAFPSVE